jgi:hypothetical protein
VLLHPSGTVNLTAPLDLELWTDAGGSPGTLVATQAVDQTALQPFGWTYADLDALSADLTPATDYHLVVRPRGSDTFSLRRSSASSGTNSQRFNGATWQAAGGQWGIRPSVATTDASSLPVELAHFGATAQGQRARLAWTTASETNNTGFSVEHDAGRGWAEVGWIEGAGTTLETRTYDWSSAQLAPGVHRFRLVQRDLDGALEVLPAVEVTILAERALSFYSVTPHPARDASMVTFTVPKDGLARLDLFDALGRRVATLHDGQAQAEGLVQAQLPAETLSAGLYLLRLSQEGQHVTRSVVVAR